MLSSQPHFFPVMCTRIRLDIFSIHVNRWFASYANKLLMIISLQISR